MRRVLVAEDDRGLAELIRVALEQAGYEVVLAYSGYDAWAASGAEVDLAILDVLMPGISGDAIAEDLARARPGLPVILMTGQSGSAFTSGARAPVLRKPFSPERLVEQVERLLD
ncbi:MAG TPA: response regulator [Gaiellaceae bacterium]|nr:response regulator [Gaiellaceae bacterium]